MALTVSSDEFKNKEYERKETPPRYMFPWNNTHEGRIAKVLLWCNAEMKCDMRELILDRKFRERGFTTQWAIGVIIKQFPQLTEAYLNYMYSKYGTYHALQCKVVWERFHKMCHKHRRTKGSGNAEFSSECPLNSKVLKPYYIAVRELIRREEAITVEAVLKEMA